MATDRIMPKFNVDRYFWTTIIKRNMMPIPAEFVFAINIAAEIDHIGCYGNDIPNISSGESFDFTVYQDAVDHAMRISFPGVYGIGNISIVMSVKRTESYIGMIFQYDKISFIHDDKSIYTASFNRPDADDIKIIADGYETIKEFLIQQYFSEVSYDQRTYVSPGYLYLIKHRLDESLDPAHYPLSIDEVTNMDINIAAISTFFWIKEMCNDCDPHFTTVTIGCDDYHTGYFVMNQNREIAKRILGKDLADARPIKIAFYYECSGSSSVPHVFKFIILPTYEDPWKDKLISSFDVTSSDLASPITLTDIFFLYSKLSAKYKELAQQYKMGESEVPDDPDDEKLNAAAIDTRHILGKLYNDDAIPQYCDNYHMTTDISIPLVLSSSLGNLIDIEKHPLTIKFQVDKYVKYHDEIDGPTYFYKMIFEVSPDKGNDWGAQVNDPWVIYACDIINPMYNSTHTPMIELDDIKKLYRKIVDLYRIYARVSN